MNIDSMREELDKKLCDRYPKIFVLRNAPSYESAMHYGFQCEDGWFKLIDLLCQKLEAIQKSTKIDITALQVKEKFGELRFYARISDVNARLNKKDKDTWRKLIYDIIGYYEDKSGSVCEICGDTHGHLCKCDGMCQTLCETHKSEVERRAKEMQAQVSKSSTNIKG